MLELCADQGTGLRHIGMSSFTRVIAVTSHGSHSNELPLLWSLCSALVELGYAATVLDGTIEEQASEPGLVQILDAQHWQLGANSDHGPWSVLPAAIGLQKICQASSGGMPPLEELEGLFDSGQIVVVFAHGDLLSRLLAKSNVQPLLAVSSAPMSLMTAYRALKQMHLAAQIHPLIVTITQENASRPINLHSEPGAALHDCARNFLNCNLRSPLIARLNAGDVVSPDMSMLVTQMLETAMPLDRHLHVTTTLRGIQPQAQFSGSH